MDSALKQEITDVIKKVLETFTLQYTKAYVLALVRMIKLEEQKKPEPWQLATRPGWEENYKTGWLVKEGAIRKSWKKRYFVVRPNFSVDYYENEAEAQKPKGKKKGTMSLCGYRVVEDPNQGILVRLKKLAEKMGVDFSNLPKPKEYPPLVFELYHPRRRCYYIQAADKQEFDAWVSEFKRACWRAYGYTIDEWCHQQAFPVAVRKTRWVLGRWGWYYGYGSEEQILSELIFDELDYDIMGRIYSKLSGPWIVRSMLRTQIRKALEAMVNAAVKPAWAGMAKTVGEVRPKIEPKIREVTEPIFKAEAQVMEKMKNAVMSVIDPILQEHVCPHLSKIVQVLKSPMVDAFDESIKIYETKIDKWEPKEDLKKSFRDLDWFPRSYWEMRSATEKTDVMYEPLWVLHEIFKDIYPWSLIWEAHDSLRKHTDNAVWTWEAALLEKQEKGEAPDTKMAIEIKQEVLHKFRHDANIATTQYFCSVMKTIVMPPFEALLHPASENIIAPIADAIPEPLREFIDIKQMFEDLYNSIVDAAIETVVGSDKVQIATNSTMTAAAAIAPPKESSPQPSSSSSSSSSSEDEDSAGGSSTKEKVEEKVVVVEKVEIFASKEVAPAQVVAAENKGPSGYIEALYTKHVLGVAGSDVMPGLPVCVQPRTTDSNNQSWVFTDGFISLAYNPTLVLDIENGETTGARVVVAFQSDAATQKWKQDGDYIVSQVSGSVLSVPSESTEPGAEVRVWEKKEQENAGQLFHFASN